MARTLVAFLSGLLFGLGLVVSRMIDPAKVLAFLDLAGRWDASLAFVMAGAVLFAGAVGWAAACITLLMRYLTYRINTIAKMRQQISKNSPSIYVA